MTFDYKFAVQAFPQILSGIPTTLLVTVCSIAVGLFIGGGLNYLQSHKVFFWGRFCRVYVSFFRSTPLIVQLYVAYFGLPEIAGLIRGEAGVSPSIFPPMLCTLTVFSLNTSAYMSELIRSAISSVDSGQMEACCSVGMTTWQSYRRVIIPQAFVEALPNIGNMFLNLIQGTSLAYSIQLMEIMAKAKFLASYGLRYMESYADASIVYWILCILFAALFRSAERKLGRSKKPLTS